MERLSSTLIRLPKQRQVESRPNLLVLLLLGIFPLILLELVRLPVLDRFENTAYDARMQLRQSLDPRPIGDKVRVIGVSDTDLQELDDDLPSRQSYIELLGIMRDWKAAAVTFDIFFLDERPADDLLAMGLSSMPTVLAYYFLRGEPDSLPPGAPPADLVDAFKTADTATDPAELVRSAADVREFLDVLVQSKNAMRSKLSDIPQKQKEELAHKLSWTRALRGALLRRWFLLTQGTDVVIPGGAMPFTAQDVRLLSPPPLLAAGAMGFANMEKGEEEVVRRVPLVYSWKGRVFPQLSLATALHYYGVEFKDVQIEWGQAIRFRPKRNGPPEIRIPIDYRGRYLVNFREAESFLERNLPLRAVVNSRHHPTALGARPELFFEGSIVLVGEVISGGSATDVEPIPLQNAFPMVGLHANVLDNILRQDFLRVAPLALRLAVAMLLGVLAALTFYVQPFAKAARITILLGVAYLLVQYLLFQLGNVVLPAVKPLLGLSGTTLAFFGYLVVVKDKDRRLVRDVFLKSVSPRIGEEILKNYNDDAIWGAQRVISVLFIDIRGYTTMSERHGPEVVLGLLDRFYDTVSEAVFRHDGQVNKFMGDAVLALFGALSEEGPDHALRAVRAAIEIQQEMMRFNDSDMVRQTGVRLNTGAGVNTGDATVGLVGRRRIRIEYTALGDAVNVASRLQTNASAGEIILAADTLVGLGGLEKLVAEYPNLEIRPAESLTVKGRVQPLQVYRIVLNPTASPVSGDS